MRLGAYYGSRILFNMPDLHPLLPLHPDSSLNPAKLDKIRQMSTEMLTRSLLPGQRDCLKTRPDGTILDGHHRTFVLRERGVDVDVLPREVVPKSSSL
jgi:hypothetical protein